MKQSWHNIHHLPVFIILRKWLQSIAALYVSDLHRKSTLQVNIWVFISSVRVRRHRFAQHKLCTPKWFGCISRPLYPGEPFRLEKFKPLTKTSVCHKLSVSIQCHMLVVVVVLGFYSPSTHFRSFQAWLAYPNCSWASLLGNLPVLSAHSFTSNWHLPFLNQRKGENDHRNYFMTKVHERICRT